MDPETVMEIDVPSSNPTSWVALNSTYDSFSRLVSAVLFFVFFLFVFNDDIIRNRYWPGLLLWTRKNSKWTTIVLLLSPWNPKERGWDWWSTPKKNKHKKYHRKQTLLFVFSVALPPSVGHDPHGGRSTGNVAKKTVGFMKRSSWKRIFI